MGSLGTPDPQLLSSDSPAPAAQDPNSIPNPSQGGPPAAPARPEVWKNVLQGALEGLAGSKGTTSLGAGLAGGAGGVLQAKQQRTENDLKQQASEREDKSLQLTGQFQTAQAAQAVAMAKVNTARAAALPQEAADAHKQIMVGLAEHLQGMGLPPVSISDDTHDGAVSALNQLASTQGSIPHLFTLELNGQHVAYDLGQLSQSPQGLTLINNMREATGQTALTPAQWSQTPPPAKAQASENALKFYAPPAPSSSQQAQGTYLQYKSTLDAYTKKPNPNPDVVKGLTDLTTKLKQVADGMKASEHADKTQDAYANAAAQKQARLDVDKAEYQDLASGDVTGWKPREGANMSQMQFNAANTAFAKGRLNSANSTENGYEMYKDAYAKHLAGDEKSGASSMMGLFAHIGTSTQGLKGMRQTQDIIHEHRDAIGIMDRAQVFINKMNNGDALSDNQWKEFGGLIQQARDNAWKNTITEAHAAGLPITDGVLPVDIQEKYRNGAGATKTKNKYSDLGAVPVRN